MASVVIEVEVVVQARATVPLPIVTDIASPLAALPTVAIIVLAAEEVPATAVPNVAVVPPDPAVLLAPSAMV